MAFILYFIFQLQSFTLRSLLFLVTVGPLFSTQSEPSLSTLQSALLEDPLAKYLIQRFLLY
jgi:hypothetical protein